MTKSTRGPIPLCRPSVGPEEWAQVQEVLASPWLAHGPKVGEFEEAFAAMVGVEHALALNSCTSALHLALKASDVTGEVILPSFTYVASANAVVAAGARPVFCEVDPQTGNLDPAEARRLVTERTQAIMPVHYAGLPCDMDAVLALAEEHDLVVVEDSAECIGGRWNGRTAGSFGIGCFSFYPTKNITTGEGGMLTTDDDELAERVKALRAHGIASSALSRENTAEPWRRVAREPGYNFRMPAILAAVGVAQLAKLEALNDRRRAHAAFLNESLAGLDGLSVPVEPPGSRHVYQMYVVRLDAAVNRTGFVNRLRSEGIGASVHFDPPVHLQPPYVESGRRSGSLERTERLAGSIVTLPMFPDLEQADLDFMVERVRVALEEARA